ncbi:MAG TPA: ABC transporter permease [Pyrinomonadaceae bacterium]|nr:ABC transporter permease [Pyrinomonadaceae bacterium]
MLNIFHDLRYAFRSLLKHRNFTTAALLTLALGIGINTGIFTLLYSLAFRELPVKNPERVVNVYQRLEGEYSREVEGSPSFLSYAEYLNYRDRVDGLAGLVASSDVKLNLGGNTVEKVSGLMVTDNYFSVLGGTSALGRTFYDKECTVPLQCPIAVLSYGFWQRRFGSDTSVIGTSIALNRQHFTVVGVAAPDFRGTEMTVPDVWLPLTAQEGIMAEGNFTSRPNLSWLSVIGRLKDIASAKQVQAQMQLVASQLDLEYPGRKTIVDVMPGSYLNSPEVRSQGAPIAMLVMAAVGLVLLIVCANVSNLMLARGSARRKEIAVRLALGASRWRLIRLLMTESLLLAVLGGIAGLFLSLVLPPILISLVPEVGLDIDLKPNVTVFLYMFAVSLLTGLVFGLAPAIQSTKPDLTVALRSGNRTRVSRPHLRNLLVVGQVAVSLVLLIGAGLLVRTLQRAQSSDVGFDSKNLIVLSMDLSALGYDESRVATLRAQLAERLQALPEVKEMSSAEIMPFAGRRDDAIDIDGEGAGISVNSNRVSPEYFETLGIHLRRGREFTEEDVRIGQSPAVITQAMANRFWSDADPIGKHFRDGDGNSHEIVGVVSDISSTHVGKLDGPLFYTTGSLAQLGEHSFLLRTNGNVNSSLNAVREAARSMDKDAFVTVEPLEENVRRALEPARTGAWFSSTVGLLALIIAATGIYGMLSYNVIERTSEVGIRMALGAQRRSVILLIVGDGMKLAVTGTAIGLAVAVILTRVLGSVVFGVATTDALAFAIVATGALVVALLACYIPARRATKVDPLVALRRE